eukprot:SAG31_NODE_37924_length_300_cov_0.875622_1_plen_67_part_01
MTALPVTDTWTDYKFGQFSDWRQQFAVGEATVTIATSAGKVLLTVTRQLTPGPLVVVVKDLWPPSGK